VLAPGMQLHELLGEAYHYHYYLLILVCYLISKIKLRGHLAQKYLEMIYFSFHRSLNEKEVTVNRSKTAGKELRGFTSSQPNGCSIRDPPPTI
jgi:hypothetical protein